MKSVRHAGIVVTDLDRSLRFYRDLLGLSIVSTREESGPCLSNMLRLPGAQATTVKLAAQDGSLIELLRFTSHAGRASPAGPTDVGVTHVAFTVDDLAQTYRRLADCGVAFNAPPQDAPEGNVRVTFCQDPDGTLIELVEARP